MLNIRLGVQGEDDQIDVEGQLVDICYDLLRAVGAIYKGLPKEAGGRLIYILKRELEERRAGK